MVQLEPASPRTRGFAKWLGVELPKDISDAHARQLIFNAPVPEKLLLIAKRIELDIDGLSYGAAGPILRKHRAIIERDLMAHSGWEVSTLLGWEDGFWLITGIVPADAKSRAKITLRRIESPSLFQHKKGKQPSRVIGILLPLSRRARTIHPYDLIDATVRRADDLQLY